MFFIYAYKCVTDSGPINFYGSFSTPLSLISQNIFLLLETDIFGPVIFCSNNRSELWSCCTPLESIVIHFSLQCRRVSINVTCSNMTQDQGLYSFVHVLVNVYESLIAYDFVNNTVSVTEETINICEL